MKLKITFLSFFIIISLPLFSFAQDGTLDTSFGTGGKVITNVGTEGSFGYDVALQGDGKIVVVGQTTNTGGDYNFGVVRYNTNGSLDTTFGSGGKVVTNFATGAYDSANAVAIQSDGKIVVVGESYNPVNNNYYFALARYNSNGSLDTTFDSDGKLTTALGNGTADVAQDVAIQPDGKIVVIGWNNYLSSRNFAVVRYNSNGSLDTTFDTDGKVLTTVGSDNVANALALQGDGKIIVAGYCSINGTVDFLLVRYNANGTLDTTFNTTGTVTTPIGTMSDSAEAVAVKDDGRIVVAGASYDGTYNSLAVARYNSDGSLDMSFDTDGTVISDLGPYSEAALDMVIQGDGKIVTSGISGNGLSNYFLTVRYNVDSSLDNTFGTNGSVTTGANTINYCHASAVVLQPDGKILSVGRSSNGSIGGFTLIRYLNTILGTETNVFSKNITFSPNPFCEQATLQSNVILENATLSLYNSIGQKVYEIDSINGQSVTISRDNIPTNGIYFFNLIQGSEIIATDKVIIVD